MIHFVIAIQNRHSNTSLSHHYHKGTCMLFSVQSTLTFVVPEVVADNATDANELLVIEPITGNAVQYSLDDSPAKQARKTSLPGKCRY